MNLKYDNKPVPKKIQNAITLLYEGPEGLIVLPHTHEAALFFADDTYWMVHKSQLKDKNNDEDKLYELSFSYDFCGSWFPDRVQNAPCVIFLPKNPDLSGHSKRFKTGKYAVVAGYGIDEMDNSRKIDEKFDVSSSSLPSYIRPLRAAALKKAPPQLANYIKIFTDIENSSNQNNSLSKLYKAMDKKAKHRDKLKQKFTREQSEAFKTLEKYGSAAIQRFFRENPHYSEDPLFMKTAIIAYNMGALYASKKFTHDRKFMESIIKINPIAYNQAGAELKNDESFILKAVSANGDLLGSIPEKARKNPAIIKAALKQDAKAINYIINDVIEDKKTTMLVLEVASKAKKVDLKILLSIMHCIPALYGHVSTDCDHMLKILRA